MTTPKTQTAPGTPPPEVLAAEAVLLDEWERHAKSTISELRDVGAVAANEMFPDASFWERCQRLLGGNLGEAPLEFRDLVDRLSVLQGAAAILHHRITCIASNDEGESLARMFDAARMRRLFLSFANEGTHG